MRSWLAPCLLLLLCALCLVWALALHHNAQALDAHRTLLWSDFAPEAQTPLRPWRSIIIHHSDSQGGSTAGIDRHHKDEKGWDGVGYHFLIGNGHGMALGAIEGTFRWYRQLAGAHAGDKTMNEHGIGICLVGDFSQAEPTSGQWARAVELCALLLEHCPGIELGRILGHRDVRATACPGDHFDLEAFRLAVAARLAHPTTP